MIHGAASMLLGDDHQFPLLFHAPGPLALRYTGILWELLIHGYPSSSTLYSIFLR